MINFGAINNQHAFLGHGVPIGFQNIVLLVHLGTFISKNELTLGIFTHKTRLGVRFFRADII